MEVLQSLAALVALVMILMGVLLFLKVIFRCEHSFRVVRMFCVPSLCGRVRIMTVKKCVRCHEVRSRRSVRTYRRFVGDRIVESYHRGC